MGNPCDEFCAVLSLVRPPPQSLGSAVKLLGLLGRVPPSQLLGARRLIPLGVGIILDWVFLYLRGMARC